MSALSDAVKVGLDALQSKNQKALAAALRDLIEAVVTGGALPEPAATPPAPKGPATRPAPVKAAGLTPRQKAIFARVRATGTR